MPDTMTPQERTHEETIRRIRFVVEELKEEGELPKTVVGRVSSIRTKLRHLFGQGTSLETLYKEEYRSLWHPSYEERFAMLPDPWDLPIEQEGVMGSNDDRERDSATTSIRYMLFLPPAREAGEAEMLEAGTEDEAEEIFIKPASRSLRPLQIKNNCTTSLTAKTHNPYLSANSGANAWKTDNKDLSIAKTSLLPGTWCRVVRGNTLLPRGALVIIDSLSPDGKTVTVISHRGVLHSGIPPDVLEPE
jgi:hypothetical protein